MMRAPELALLCGLAWALPTSVVQGQSAEGGGVSASRVAPAVVEPESVDAAWVAVAPAALASEVAPLAEHRRRRGLTAAVVTWESVLAGFAAGSREESLQRFLQNAGARGGARFVLLVGDGRTIPGRNGPSFFGKPCFTDQLFVCDDADALPDRAIGRIPTTDAESVRRIVHRTMEYELDAKPAGWKRRVSFLAADGGFGPALDAALEGAVAGILDRGLPPELDLRVLRSNAKSSFGVPASEEKKSILELWGSGALIGLYAGHGSRHGLHTAKESGGTRPIFTTADASKLEIRRGAPFLVFFACHTGDFRPTGREPQDPMDEGLSTAARLPSCLAASVLEAPQGAIAALGASQISHPYVDLLLAHELCGLFRQNPKLPVGELIREAKGRVYRGGGKFRENADRVAKTFGVTEADQKRLVDYQMALYNLMGDPAVVLRRPELDLKLDVTRGAEPKGGEEVEVKITIPSDRAAALEGASVIVALEQGRASAPLRTGFPQSSDRTLDRTTVELHGGSATALLRYPATLTARRFVVVADVRAGELQGIAAAVLPAVAASSELDEAGTIPSPDSLPTSQPASSQPAGSQLERSQSEGSQQGRLQAESGVDSKTSKQNAPDGSASRPGR